MPAHSSFSLNYLPSCHARGRARWSAYGLQVQERCEPGYDPVTELRGINTMRARPFVRILLAASICFCAALLGPAWPAAALETDQYTTPGHALPDIGPEMDIYITGTIWDVAQVLNMKAADQERAARRAPWPFKDYHRGRARRFRSADLLAQRVYDALSGPMLPECRIEQWVHEHRFRAAAQDPSGQTEFTVSLGDCVYGDSLFNKPILLAFLSPTINVHQTYMGGDKLGHLFQHGYQYYEVYRDAEDDGCEDNVAVARAVDMGIDQEFGIYGLLTTGVYSNADMAGNLAGLRFYLNLTRPVPLGDVTLPPLLLRDKAGNWVFNPLRRPEGLLRPFVSDHLNEALNPSRYDGGLRDTVRERLRSRAEKCLEFYSLSPGRDRERMVELSTWHGMQYGHSGFGGLVTIADGLPRSSDLAAAPEPSRPRTAAARLSTR